MARILPVSVADYSGESKRGPPAAKVAWAGGAADDDTAYRAKQSPSSNTPSSLSNARGRPRIPRSATVVVDSPGVSSFYSPMAAASLMLNLELGSGVLLLPAAFAEAGLGLGCIFLLLICFCAWVSGSWVVEAMAIANHQRKWAMKDNEEARREALRDEETGAVPVHHHPHHQDGAESNPGGAAPPATIPATNDDKEGGGDDNTKASTIDNNDSASTFSLTHTVQMGSLAQTFFPLWAQVRSLLVSRTSRARPRPRRSPSLALAS